MVKILMLNTTETKLGGITNVIFNLLENIRDSDLQFGYVSINTPSKEFVERLKKNNCRLYIVHRKAKNLHSYICTLSKIASGYDVIHVHGNSATLAIDLFAAKMAGIKYRIAHSHNTSCKMVVAAKILRPFFYYLCNGRLACSKAAGKWLYANRTFDVIQNGINTERFRFNYNKRCEIRKSLGWEDNLVIGHVGNFVEAKNHKYIFEIIQDAIRKNKSVRLICVGGGRLLDSSCEYIDELGLSDYIHITGCVDNPEDYMSAMDAVVMPSLHEGLPLTLVEEQANGLKCLVSDAVTREADLTGNLYFLPLSASVSKWSELLLELIHLENTDRTSVSDKCISQIKEKGYDISTEAKKLSDYYKNLS